MELQQYFQQVMQESAHMALATSVEKQPNVRVVTFGYDPAQADRLYFCTFKGNRKITEFAANPQVACMPLAQGPEAAAQVRIFGRVQKSAQTLEQLIALIAPKVPDDANTLKDGGEMLDIYEVVFPEAWITVGMEEAQRYVIGQ